MFLSNLLLAISLIVMFITALLSWMFVCIFLMSWQALGIYRLSDVVFKLRNRGYDIETKRKTVMNKWQEKTSFAEYKLERAS